MTESNMSEGTAAPDATSAPEVAVATAPKAKAVFFSRFSMRAPLVVAGQARPDIESVLMFGIYRDNPRLQVKTNDPNDENNNYGKVVAAMDPLTFGTLIAHIEELIKNPTKDVRVIDNFNLYKGGQKFDEPQFINRTMVGRDDEGRIWIKIVEDGRPAPTFVFGPPKFHVHIRMDKTPVPAAEMSQRYAAAFCRILTQVITSSIGKRDDGEEDAASANKPPQEQREPRQGGNWGNRQGGGGGNWGNRQGGGGNWGNRGGNNWQGRQGGGGGNWQGRQGGGGGGNWGNRGGNGSGNGGGNWGNRQGGGAGGQVQAANVSNDDITF